MPPTLAPAVTPARSTVSSSQCVQPHSSHDCRLSFLYPIKKNKKNLPRYFNSHLRVLLSQGEVKATRGGRAIVIKARTMQPPKPPGQPKDKAKAQDKSPGKKTLAKAPRAALRGLPPITPEEADKQWRASLAKDEVAQMVATDHKAELLLKTFEIFLKSKKMYGKWQPFHHFGPISRVFLSSTTPTCVVLYALLGAFAHRVRIGACNPMECPIHVFQASGARRQGSGAAPVLLPRE